MYTVATDEDIKDMAGFKTAALAARQAGKSILAIKGGRSAAGQRAVAAHTGAEAGSYERYQTLLDECGVSRVASLTEMVDAARLMLMSDPPVTGKRIGVMTVSGGAGVLICDAARDAGLNVPDLPSDLRQTLNGILPPYVQRQNPIDVTGAVLSNPAMLDQIVSALARNDAFDAIVLFFGSLASIKSEIIDCIRRAKSYGKPVIVIWMGAKADALAAIFDIGVPVFAEIPPAIVALGHASKASAPAHD